MATKHWKNKWIFIVLLFLFVIGLELQRHRLDLMSFEDEFDTKVFDLKLKPLIFTISNGGFLDFTLNWRLNWQQHHINDTLIVCTDRECVQELDQIDTSINSQLIDLHQNDDFFVYGGAQYGKLVNMRPMILLKLYTEHYAKYILNNTSYNALLYMDADMGIVQNFIAEELPAKYTHFDMSLVSDGVGSAWYMCSCIIFIPFKQHNYHKIVYFLNKWQKVGDQLATLWHKTQNQYAFNQVLKRNILNVGHLNIEQYPNGQLMQDEEWRKEHFNIQNTKINTIHANYMKGAEKKKQFLVNNKYWFLN
eukprot:661951_1